MELRRFQPNQAKKNLQSVRRLLSSCKHYRPLSKGAAAQRKKDGLLLLCSVIGAAIPDLDKLL
eukprot:scaffold926_cov408-Prasinococcus_capsulatus_cf.AAC.19